MSLILENSPQLLFQISSLLPPSPGIPVCGCYTFCDCPNTPDVLLRFPQCFLSASQCGKFLLTHLEGTLWDSLLSHTQPAERLVRGALHSCPVVLIPGIFDSHGFHTSAHTTQRFCMPSTGALGMLITVALKPWCDNASISAESKSAAV